MHHPPTRRDFLTQAAFAAAAVPAGSQLPFLWCVPPGQLPEHGAPPTLRARPFGLHLVRLDEGPWLRALETNRAYMMSLEPDRLLHMFRLTAGLPSSAEPYLGWEAPNNELRGHFVGHYLSACALMAAQTGDAEVLGRGTHLREASRRDGRDHSPRQGALGHRVTSAAWGGRA